jgi:HK97 family phage prohead protease
MIQRISVPLDLKALKSREFEGYGSTFGNVDHGGEAVLPGAFDKSLAEHKASGTLPQMFWMHDPAQVPGAWTEMASDSRGLYVKGQLADTQLGNEIRTLMGMKAVRGLSIGYRVTDSDYDKNGVRLLKEIDLWEVSPVSLAMNPMAQITAAKARLSAEGEYVPTEREFEMHLRDAGCSRKVAATLVAKLYGDHSTSGMLDEASIDPAALQAAEELAAKFAVGCLRKF